MMEMMEMTSPKRLIWGFGRAGTPVIFSTMLRSCGLGCVLVCADVLVMGIILLGMEANKCIPSRRAEDSIVDCIGFKV